MINILKKIKKYSLKKQILLGIGAIFLLLLIYVGILWIRLPSYIDITSQRYIQSSKIYDRTGKVLLYEFSGDQKRTVVSQEDIPDIARKAVLAIEDHNFYNHGAIEPRSIARAVIYDFIHPGELQGGSTITQQLARNAFLTTKKTIDRKISEIVLSYKLERIYTKDQILTMYLNQIPYGLQIYGIESASQSYFGKSAKNLDLAQAATLAALIQSPSRLSPYGSHTDLLKARQERVLDNMVKYGWATKADAVKAKAEKLVYQPQVNSMLAPHFVYYALDQLADRYTEDDLINNGYSIITTLDADLQTKAEELVSKYSQTNKAAGVGNMALVAEDPKTGEVLAMVGSSDYYDVNNQGNFNAALGIRQPGSAFKPFAYLEAFKKGYLPTTVLWDVPTNFSTNTTPYTPQNYDGLYHGAVDMRHALAQSLNIPAVKTLYLADIGDTIDLATKLGITTLTKKPSDYGLALVLGGGGVKLVDMVGAYSTLSQEGVKVSQSSILEIKDSRGQVIYQKPAAVSERVIDPEPVRVLNDVLSDNDARYPIFAANTPLQVAGYKVAVKTGTSQDYRDAWTVGYTPTIAVGVWGGNNDYSPAQVGGSGERIAAACWHDFIIAAISKLGTESFNPPQVASVNKPMFNDDSIVTRQVNVDKTTGQIAGPLTNQNNIEVRSYQEVHSILYYVNKSDPTGPIPSNPQNDPQYWNWENPVINWANRNIPNFQSYNQTLPNDPNQPPSDAKVPTVNIEYPKDGDYMNTDFTVEASINSNYSVSQASLYLNDTLIGTLSPITLVDSVTNQSRIVYRSNPINFSQIQEQNELKVVATNQYSQQGSDSLMIFKNTP
ncbi:MAG TPA: transglycosylase domain-containing protein [Candidatus Paceibacterota bacterium]|nr:transglycosylase domain-containing protein [Candidatus Paceibacterota bacterium]